MKYSRWSLKISRWQINSAIANKYNSLCFHSHWRDKFSLRLRIYVLFYRDGFISCFKMSFRCRYFVTHEYLICQAIVKYSQRKFCDFRCEYINVAAVNISHWFGRFSTSFNFYPNYSSDVKNKCNTPYSVHSHNHAFLLPKSKKKS